MQPATAARMIASLRRELAVPPQHPAFTVAVGALPRPGVARPRARRGVRVAASGRGGVGVAAWRLPAAAGQRRGAGPRRRPPRPRVPQRLPPPRDQARRRAVHGQGAGVPVPRLDLRARRSAAPRAAPGVVPAAADRRPQPRRAAGRRAPPPDLARRRVERPSVAGYLGELVGELASLDLASHVAHCEVRVTRRCNWKLVIEAFLDGYHIRTLHRDSIYRFFLDAASTAEQVSPHIRAVTARRELTGWHRP